MKNTVINEAIRPDKFLPEAGILIFIAMLLNVTSSMAQLQTVRAEDAGISSRLEQNINQAHDRGELENLHGIVILRHGKIALESYYSGQDEIWGAPVGPVEFNADTLHDMRSVTKSIVSLLYGIALEQNRVPPVDHPLLQSYTQYQDLINDPARNAIRIEHVLTMTMGLEWNEDLPYSSHYNSEIAMEQAADRYYYILSRDVHHPPGRHWEYSGGTTALLGHLITRGTRQDIFSYAATHLFEPMGITEVAWTRGTNGEPSVASGLRLKPRDLLKIGQLILNRGVWGKQPLVPAAWLDQSFAPASDTGNGIQYGYQWWIGNMKKDGIKWVSAFGNGGQRLIIIPDLDLVVVITAGNYNHPEQWRLPVKLMSEFIIPAVRH